MSFPPKATFLPCWLKHSVMTMLVWSAAECPAAGCATYRHLSVLRSFAAVGFFCRWRILPFRMTSATIGEPWAECGSTTYRWVMASPLWTKSFKNASSVNVAVNDVFKEKTDHMTTMLSRLLVVGQRELFWCYSLQLHRPDPLSQLLSSRLHLLQAAVSAICCRHLTAVEHH